MLPTIGYAGNFPWRSGKTSDSGRKSGFTPQSWCAAAFALRTFPSASQIRIASTAWTMTEFARPWDAMISWYLLMRQVGDDHR